MADAAPTDSASRTRTGLAILGWSVLAAGFLYYLVAAVEFRFLTPGQLGPTLWNRAAWFYLHLGLALPAAVIGPFQLSRRLRTARPKLHRWMGRIYVTCAALSALTAIVLAVTSEYPMDRPALAPLAALWLFFTLSAYACARRRDFAAHRLFAIRSYGAVVAFVLLRLIVEAPVGRLLSFIANADALEAVETWLAVAIVLFGVELIFSWIPQARGRFRFRPRETGP